MDVCLLLSIYFLIIIYRIYLHHSSCSHSHRTLPQDLADTQELLHSSNVDRNALLDYAREAADFSTSYQLPHLDFAVNHYGKPDVAMFDFTSMFAAENACKMWERNGHKLLTGLIGDTLLEVR